VALAVLDGEGEGEAVRLPEGEIELRLLKKGKV
jgi:hypothetical protein